MPHTAKIRQTYIHTYTCTRARGREGGEEMGGREARKERGRETRKEERGERGA